MPGREYRAPFSFVKIDLKVGKQYFLKSEYDYKFKF